jgi:hypothetical protein
MSVIRSMKKVFRLGLAALAIGLAGCTPLEIVGVGAAACVVDCAPVKRLYDETANGVVDTLVDTGSGIKRGITDALQAQQDASAPSNEFWATKVKDDLVVVYGRSNPNHNFTQVSQRARIRAAHVGRYLGHEAFQVVYEGANEVQRHFQDSGLQADQRWFGYNLTGWADDATYARDYNYRLIVRLIKYDTARVSRAAVNIDHFLSTTQQ